MPAVEKYTMVEDLRERLSRSKAVFVCEYRGMSVKQITALRAQVRAAGGEMKVAKNTLMRIAMQEEGLPAFPDDIVAEVLQKTGGDINLEKPAKKNFGTTGKG